ncbi:MAG TPA: GntR family transcriptional regulator [Solirubrobacteraceae bacterium]|nr:GntR family transcriptional regulator [Solirubrobacteraceae bacterium]
MSPAAPLHRATTVDTLADALRGRILDGELEPGTSLREQHLAADYAVARHTVRAALRALANEGLVRIETHRGAHVTELTSADVEALGELRIALETEAARLALLRGAGRLPDPVHRAQATLTKAARRPGFAALTDAHEALHHAIVHAAASPRIEAAHAALAGELRLFLTRLRPAYDGATLAAEHAALLDDLEHGIGPEALRVHIETSTRALLSAMR